MIETVHLHRRHRQPSILRLSRLQDLSGALVSKLPFAVDYFGAGEFSRMELGWSPAVYSKPTLQVHGRRVSTRSMPT